MRPTTSLLLGAVLAVYFAITPLCVSAEPRSGGVINVVVQPEPPGLMLGLTQNGPTQMVAGNIYESL
ncbi:MAG: ABC transporter substrate-binding protein, partial [Kiloniellales bacterium]|nr:ABC transporter substrate-binding protein [Kiloniellales bacterium]